MKHNRETSRMIDVADVFFSTVKLEKTNPHIYLQ